MAKDGPRVVLEVYVIGKAVCVRYLEFPYKFRGYGKLHTAANGFSIHSIDYPEIGDTYLKIPGRAETHDDLTAQRRLGSKELAIDLANTIISSVTDLNTRIAGERVEPETKVAAFTLVR